MPWNVAVSVDAGHIWRCCGGCWTFLAQVTSSFEELVTAQDLKGLHLGVFTSDLGLWSGNPGLGLRKRPSDLRNSTVI